MTEIVVRHDRNGVRYVQPYLGKNRVTGRPMRPYRRFPDAATDEEALEQARAWMATVEGAARLGTSPRLGDVLEAYVRSLEVGGASPNTVRTYRGYARLYVGPTVGSQPAAALGAIDFSRLQDGLLSGEAGVGGPLSCQTVAGLHWFLSGAYRWLCSLGIVPANPVGAIDGPRLSAGCATAYDDSEFSVLESALEGELSAVPVDRSGRRRRNVAFAAWVSLHTGLRVGEVCALRRRDVQSFRRVVSVNATAVEVSGAGVVRKPRPKSAAGRRNVSVSREDSEEFARHERWQDSWLASASRDTPLCTLDGSPMRPTAVSRGFSEIRDELGLPKGTSFHSLRHTHATWLLVAGIDPKTVSERLGHSSVATTLRIYAHVLPGRDSSAAEGFSRLAREMAGGDAVRAEGCANTMQIGGPRNDGETGTEHQADAASGEGASVHGADKK